jgi:2-amino-4-hydroxy-6-hydroxymethyldihydropteridine diphosphokinase
MASGGEPSRTGGPAGSPPLVSRVQTPPSAAQLRKRPLSAVAVEDARRGFLGLGSNIGDRRGFLAAAVAALPGHGVEVVASSSVYDTEPVGLVLDQPSFLNACLCVSTALEPLELLDACKAVERSVGRTAGVRHGPRVIDVDVLLLGSLEFCSERLTLPHPEVTSRRFVMVPLLELDPALALPGGARVADALVALGGAGQEVRLAGPPLA